MAFSLADLVGIFGGGRAQVTAGAASAKIASEVSNTRATLLDKFTKLGEKIGPTVGPDFFSAVAAGAIPAASEARAGELSRLGGPRLDPRAVFSQLQGAAPWLLILGAAGVLWLFARRA